MKNIIIRAIEDAAYECGTILDVRQFAAENGYLEQDPITFDWDISYTSLREIADIFTEGYDTLVY